MIMEEEELEELEEELEMSTTATTTTLVLPKEIIMDILSRLPAKSLVTIFKLVCKPWRTLIHNPDFVQMHLNRRVASTSINGDGGGGGGGGGTSLIRKPNEYGNALFQLQPPLNCDDQSPFVFEDVPIAVATQLDFDLLPSISRLSSSSTLVGSCNGLLCLSLDYDERIVLLNPSTRKYKISPIELIDKCANDFTFDDNVAYGFGCFHNSTTTMDEYKVVRIAFFYPHDYDDDFSFSFQINIYSMSSNSWRRVKGIPPRSKCFGQRSSGVFLNGVVHWMGCNHGYFDDSYIWDTIVSFNIEDEEFRQMPMAPWGSIVVPVSDDVILMNWRGYLGMIYCSRTKRMDIDLEIWVMKEYGIGESWTKEFVIRTSDSAPLRELPAGFSIQSRCIMTCFWTGDQILIVGKYLMAAPHVGSSSNVWRIYGRLVLYDMNRKKINNDALMVDIHCELRNEQVDYIDTLVSLKSSLLPLNNNKKRKNL